MKNNEFNFCPECGKKNISYKDGKKWYCSDCGFDLYNNVASAVGAIISDKEGNVLFEVRAKEPEKGKLALPGGFTDRCETAEEAVVRECYEEIGIKPDSIKYLCSFPNDYEYKTIMYKTCDLFFEAVVPESEGAIMDLLKRLHGQQSEVEGFRICKIQSEDDIRNLPIAFDSSRKALAVWLSNRQS